MFRGKTQSFGTMRPVYVRARLRREMRHNIRKGRREAKQIEERTRGDIAAIVRQIGIDEHEPFLRGIRSLENAADILQRQDVYLRMVGDIVIARLEHHREEIFLAVSAGFRTNGNGHQ